MTWMTDGRKRADSVRRINEVIKSLNVLYLTEVINVLCSQKFNKYICACTLGWPFETCSRTCYYSVIIIVNCLLINFIASVYSF